MDDDTRRFLAQNETAAETLHDQADTLDLYSSHHAGGMFVLWRWISDELSVKMHDSWGGPDDQGRDVVVHVYSTEDDSHDVVNYYATGREALEAFLSADENTKEA